MSEQFTIGVDIGGTKVATGLVDSRGTIVFKTRVPMVSTGTAEQGFSAVRAAIEAVYAAQPQARALVRGIGVCSPGPLDPHTGVVLNPPNLPCWRNYGLAEAVTRAFDVPTKVENDANAAALAEAIWGAGVGYRNVFYGTLGTGVGTGFILEQRIYNGRTGAAPEGGHMTIDYRGPRCGCGKHGCVEALVAGPAIAQRARDYLAQGLESAKLTSLCEGKLNTLTSHMVGEAHAQGDPLATRVLTETAELITIWLGNIIDLLEPDVIIIGGGVSLLMQPFFEEIHANLPKHAINQRATEIPLLHARYGEDAGVAGAAALV